MSLLALIGEGANPVEVAQPALSTLDKSVIGALLVVSWLITGTLIWQLIKCQNARTQDQKDMREVSDKTTVIIITAVSDMKGSLDKLTTSDEHSRGILSAMKQTLDLLLLLSGGRRLSPPAGVPAPPPQQSPDAKGG